MISHASLGAGDIWHHPRFDESPQIDQQTLRQGHDADPSLALPATTESLLEPAAVLAVRVDSTATARPTGSSVPAPVGSPLC